MFLFASAFAESLLILFLSLALDAVLGEPPDKLHPTVWMGKVIAFLKQRLTCSSPRRAKLNGVLLAVTVILVFAVPAYLVLFLVKHFAGWVAYVILSALWLKTTFAVRCMRDYTRPISSALVCGNQDEAKRRLRYIVRRRPESLNERQIVSAAVESIAESTTDGVTSPLFYYALLGVPGAVAYRVVNTLDSMVGYRDEEYQHIGLFSAKLDTLANYVPARVTALLMVLAALFLNADSRAALRIMRRDRKKTSSPNAGWTMSAMAGLLCVKLEKPGHYSLGDDCSPLSPMHIQKALHVMYVSTLLFVLLIAVPIMLFSTWLASFT